MAQQNIGQILRQSRINAGYKVQEVSQIMKATGYEKASVKTVYSWESGNSQPSPDYFLKLCDIYKVNDILSTFGYTAPMISAPNNEYPNYSGLSHKERQLILICRSLNKAGQDKVVDYADDLVSSGKYVPENKKIRPLYKQTEKESISIQAIARGGRIDHIDKELDIDEIERAIRETPSET